jgi:hypothetical protein
VTTVSNPGEEWPGLRVALVVVAVLVAAQIAGWVVYRSVHDDPTALELTERCLRREKLLAVDLGRNDPIARTARGGALVTRVEGEGVQVAIARSEEEAGRIVSAYMASGRKIALRLEVRGKVVYVWEAPRRPSPTKRQTMYDCWYE